MMVALLDGLGGDHDPPGPSDCGCAFGWRTIGSESRFPLFGIML
jgi:hypothetical protein